MGSVYIIPIVIKFVPSKYPIFASGRRKNSTKMRDIPYHTKNTPESFPIDVFIVVFL